jgi:hypothetical protein
MKNLLALSKKWWMNAMNWRDFFNANSNVREGLNGAAKKAILLLVLRI